MVLTYAGLLDYSHSDSEASASQALTLRQHSRQLGGHQCGKKAGPKMIINFAPFSDIHFNFNRMKMR